MAKAKHNLPPGWTYKQVYSVVTELNTVMGWEPEDYTTVEEVATLPIDNYDQEDVDKLSSLSLLFLDGAHEDFRERFTYKRLTTVKEASEEVKIPKEEGISAKAAKQAETAVKKVLKEKKSTKKLAASILLDTKPHKWDCRFIIFKVLFAAPLPLSVRDMIGLVRRYSTVEFERSFPKKEAEQSILFHLPMYIHAGLVKENLDGEEATYETINPWRE